MTFSINNNGGFKPIENKKISFTGSKPEYDDMNNAVERFILPVSLKSGETAILEVADLTKVKKGEKWVWDKENVRSYNFNGQDVLDINQDEFTDAYAYRYKIIDDKQNKSVILDKSRSGFVGDTKWNMVVRGQNEGITPAGGSMYHVFIDSEGKYDSKTKKLNSDPNFVRNHFNKLGGSIGSLIYLLDNTDEFEPYRYIISTPDIGVDPTSSHKYWPNNSYQCGNMQDFKDFNWKLFEQGKGYVADGAFTSQSLQSPMVQHVLKWGKLSPLHNMLKIDAKPSLGILPDDVADDESEAFKHIGIRLVNPKGENYDKSKATYIQFYDDRLSSPRQISSDKLITSYDTPNPKDHYDITTHQDSIQPFYFEISPDDPKLKEFGSKKSMLCKDIKDLDNFLTFPNYKISTKGNASGATYWDGNSDIIKMNLSNPKPGTEKGFKDARNYLYGVASYWTEMVQSDILLRTAQSRDEKKREIASKNDIDYDTLVAFSGVAESNILRQNKTVSDYVSEFPMQSMETSPELSAIFLQKEFKNEFLNNEVQDILTKYVDEVITNAIPKEFENNEEYKTYAVKTLSNTILRSLFANAMNKKAIDEDGNINLAQLKQVTLNSMLTHTPSTPADEREQVVKYINKGLDKTLDDIYFKQDLILKAKEALNHVSLEDFRVADSLILQAKGGLNWRFDAAKDIGDLDAVRSQNGVSFNDVWNGKGGVKEFWGEFIKNVKDYNPSAYIISEITNLWEFYSDNPEKAQFDITGMDPDELEQHFLAETGSTTSSNYSTYFNNLSAFVGVDPENGYNRAGSAGNINALKSNVDQFIDKNQANAIILSHSFTNNHDKPTILHTLPLDMQLFLFNDKTGFKEDAPLSEAPQEYKDLATKITGGRDDYAWISAKAIAVADAMLKAINEANLSEDDKVKLREAVKYLANGQKDKNSEYSLKRANAYGYLPYEVTIKDLIRMAGVEDEDGSKLQEIHYTMMKNPMKMQEGLWEMMNAIPGIPTLYNGTEFAQTGYETPSKNMYLGNRNPILHEMKEKEGYKQYYKKMNAISGLYKEPGMSATRNGYPVSLNVSDSSGASFPEGTNMGALNYMVSQILENGGVEALRRFIDNNDLSDSSIENTFHIDGSNNNHENFRKMLEEGTIEKALVNPTLQLWPIFKYDDKGSKTISVVTNYNIPRNQSAKDFKGTSAQTSTKEIMIRDDNGSSPLEEGTTLFRKVYSEKYGKFIDDDVVYKVKDGKIVTQNGEDITIDDTVLNFYVPTKGQISAKRDARFH